MAVPYFIADSAQVTVLRSLASTAFGKYGLKLPEGVDLEDVYEVAAPGNELAYVSSLGSARRVGGMFRRFVRADVNITAQGEGMVPASDVERVLDEAAKRVSGDFFLESDISKAGLGAWVPFVDFHVGDIANVEIWGRVVPLVVTRIEPKRTEHSDDDWSVHVGGQLLSDSEARLAENADIYNAVVSDRRELAGLDGKIRAETANRKAAISAEARRSDAYADSVASGVESRLSRDFEASYERYSKSLQQLGDTWRQELQNGLSAEQQARAEALRQEQLAREKAGTDLRGQLEKTLDDAVAGERKARESAISSESSARQQAISGERQARSDAISAEQRDRDAAIRAEAQARALADSEEARARQKAISDLSQSFTTDLQAYGELVKEAKNYVDPATAQVVAFWSKENQNNFNKAVQLTLAAQSAYNDINNIKWVSQDAWNEQQNKINEARAKFESQQLQINDQNEEFRRLTEQLDAQQTEQIEQLQAVQKQLAEESQGRIREIMATPTGTSDPNLRVKNTMKDGSPGWSFWIEGLPKGTLFDVSYFTAESTSISYVRTLKLDNRILGNASADRVNIDCDPTISYVNLRWTEQAKKQITINNSGGPWDIDRSSWTYVMSSPAPSKTARQVALRLKVTWAAATYDDSYRIKLKAGNRVLKEYSTTKLGPASIFGNGERWMSTTVSNATVYSGETIKVEVYSTAALPGGRRVKSAELTGTWIEDV
ncbi:hypothetical protein J8244_09370 [Corynebacterium tuberculostearicum]|uniref:hypothetical protein n=1 Tax=Corynebacterium tuberculostearicum TaxID=38304 RepID=UPI002665477A|nr:hypothetical protein [Corynebacterium tuberculostearicum]WKE50330.1 hypothetical protein J8244_09370 [Corynebacterium tuberculostearicum]